MPPKYDRLGKKFLSKLHYEHSSISWHVSLEERSETDVQIRSEIRISDCTKFIVIDMNACLADPQKYTKESDAKVFAQKRLDKIDCLIEELMEYRQAYHSALSTHWESNDDVLRLNRKEEH